MKKFIIALVTFILLLAILLTFIIISGVIWYKTYKHVPDPLLVESTEHIREKLLEVTPTGMNKDDVVKIIKDNKKWKSSYEDNEYSYNVLDHKVKKTSIRVLIGKYRIAKSIGTGMTSVVVFWEFDEDSKLVDIYISKDTDVL